MPRSSVERRAGGCRGRTRRHGDRPGRAHDRRQPDRQDRPHPPETPDVTLDPPSRDVALTSAITAVALDTPSGLAGGEWWIGADPGVGLAAPLTLTSGELHGTIPATLPPGNHTVWVRAVDVAGNWSDPGSGELTVTSEGGTNAPPTATSQDVTTAEDTSKVITLSGTDGDGDELAFDVVADPEHGRLTGSDANRTYTPDPDFHGSDSFTFVADDGLAQSQPATVTITVTPVNDAPIVTAPVTASSVEGSPVPVAAVVADVDGDTPTVTWVVTPTPSVDAGAASGITPQAAATSIYACNDDGTFTAVATADDEPHGGSATASVAVTVTNANPAITITIAPSLPAPPGASVDVAAVVTDPGSNDTHLCAIDWGDGSVAGAARDAFVRRIPCLCFQGGQARRRVHDG